jgi:drug/metabolite transporter (DMT)-like permease
MKWFLLILLSVIWGSSYMLMKRGLEGFTYIEVGLIRSSLAGIVLFPFAIYHIRKVKKHHIKPLALSVALGTFIPNLLFAKAQTQIGGGMTGILNALSPLFIVVIGTVFFKTKSDKSVWYGVLLGLLGCAIMLYFTQGVQTKGNSLYSMIILLTAFMGAMNVQIIHHYLNDIKPLALASVTLSTASVMSSTYLFTQTNVWEHIQQPKGQLSFLYVAILAIIGSAVALILFNHLLSISNAVFSSAITYLMPVVSVSWGFLDNEPFMWAHGAGMVLIFTGIYITNLKKRGLNNPKWAFNRYKNNPKS